MGSGTSRPIRSNGRPPGRRGKGGTGPGPGYRPNTYTGGKKGGGTGKSSSSVSGPIAVVMYGIATFAVTVPLGLVTFLLHGHGVI